MIVHDKSNKICTLIEFTCPADTSITSKVWNKLKNTYGLLIRNMQITYPDYQLQVMLIIVGALGYVPKCLNSYMNDLGFNDKEIKMHMNKMQ